MKEFVLIFRNSANPDFKPSPEQMQQFMTDWMSWMEGMAADNQLADRGHRLSMSEACTVQGGGLVTDGPYTEVREFINGYLIVRTETIQEAAVLAGGCPIVRIGGRVEVRKIVAPDDNS